MAEVALLFLLLFVFAGSPPPGDDEAHYLGKAKHYWNPAWLAGDFFLETPDAHVVFNWTIGWLTLFVSLDATAWIGRCAAWLLLAAAWRQLSWTIVPRPLVSLLSMALFLVFQQFGTAAREWIVGGVEAKCFAWALVVFALAQLVRSQGFGVQGSGFRKEEETSSIAAIPTGRGLRHWNLVWLLLGLASAFHVLVGGWAVVAALATWVATKDRPQLLSMLPALALGGIVSLLGVIPALQLSAGADPAIVREAHRIYVFERLSHHLLVHDFPWRYRLQFLGVLAMWLAVSYATRTTTRAAPLRKFIFASLAIAFIGLVIDQATLYHPDVAASLLRFYWFRLADMLVPIGLALGLVEWWSILSFHRDPTGSAFPRKTPVSLSAAPLLLAALCLLPMFVLGWRSVARMTDRRTGSEIQAGLSADEAADWRDVCDWVHRQTPVDSRVLLPPGPQCFRWHAQRSEVANWKDIPQNAAAIVEWRDRMQRTRGWWNALRRHGYTPQVEQRLHDLASRYDVQYVIVPRGATSEPLPLTPLYATPAYVVYWLPPP